MAGIDVKDFTLGTAKKIRATTVATEELTHHILHDTAGAEVLGAVTASPAANTIGDRLKTLATGLFAKGTLAAPSTEVMSVIPPAMTQVTATFNRPANVTAYAANDAVNDNATAGGGSSALLSFTIAAGRGRIQRIRIRKSDQTVATPTLRAWIYQATLVQTAGDNEAFGTSQPVADLIDFKDVAVTVQGGDDAVGFINCDIPFVSAALKMQLQTLSGFTPASGETFTVDLWYLPG